MNIDDPNDQVGNNIQHQPVGTGQPSASSDHQTGAGAGATSGAGAAQGAVPKAGYTTGAEFQATQGHIQSNTGATTGTQGQAEGQNRTTYGHQQSLPEGQRIGTSSDVGTSIQNIYLTQYNAQNMKQNYHITRIQRIQKLGNKRTKSESPLQGLQINLPSVQSSQLQESNQSQLNIRQTPSEFSMQSSIEFQRQYEQTTRVQQTKFSQLISEYRNNNLDEILLQLQHAQKSNEKFKEDAFKQTQSDFMADASHHIKFLDKKIYELMTSSNNTHRNLYLKIEGINNSTMKLFEWYHDNNQKEFMERESQINVLRSKFNNITQTVTQTDECIELLLHQVENLDTNDSRLESKVYNIYKEILVILESKLKDIIHQINQQEHFINDLRNEAFSKINELQFHTISLITEAEQKVTNAEAIIVSQENRITQLEYNMQEMAKHIQSLDKMCQVSYFTSNLLIDQDKDIKLGIQESSSKQANILDLITMTNKMLQQNLPDQQLKQHIDTQFKDSVQSLHLDRKVELNLPQVNKIPEFMSVNHNDIPNERYQIDRRAYDEHRAQYNQNLNQFFQKFPKDQTFFMQTGIKNEEVQQEPTFNINRSEPQPPRSETPQTQTNFVNMQKSEYDNLQNDLNRLRGLNTNSNGPSPTINILKKEQQSTTSNVNPQSQQSRQNFFSQFNQAKKEPTFDYDQYRKTMSQTKPQNVVYSSAPQQKTYYHKFNFRQKYNRNIHPRIYLFQFETMAKQYDLTDDQKCLQLMFVMEGEFLDWYKSRYCVENPPSWHELALDFIKTYSTSNEDAKEELLKLSQKQIESANQFLQRLRQTIKTSDLTNDDVKKQLASGLSSEIAKQYITYMKQFNRQMYNQHTSTTLLQELYKQSSLYKFNLNAAKSSTSATPGKTTTTRYFRYPNKYNSSKPSYQKPTSGTASAKENKPSYSKKSVHFLDDIDPNVKSIDETRLLSIEPSFGLVASKDSSKDPTPLSHAINIDENQDNNLDPNFDFKDDELEQILVRIEETKDEPEITHASSVLVVGDLIQTPPELNFDNANLQAGEATQLNNVFRKGQKQQNTYTEKLVDIANKGKQLPYTNIQTVKQMQYFTLPEKQLLEEAPTQFINACKYLKQALISQSNILQTSQTTLNMDMLINALSSRLEKVQPIQMLKPQDGQSQSQQDVSNSVIMNVMDSKSDIIQASLSTKQIDYLLYINIKFENTQVLALLDTGSSATVISENFCKQNKLQIPNCKYSREVTVADGSKALWREWTNARIKLDDYMSVMTDVLISKGTTYDMLLGLNVCEAIGATISSTHLRYSVIIKDKERFGKIQLVKQSAKKSQ